MGHSQFGRRPPPQPHEPQPDTEPCPSETPRPDDVSFTDCVIPTILDMPEVTIAAFVEEPEPVAPYGAKGIGDPPPSCVSRKERNKSKRTTGSAP